MTVRVPVAGLAPGERELSADTSRYLTRVLRLAVDDRFVAFDPDARTEADAVVIETHPQKTRVRIESPRAAAVIATAKLVLVYALAKGDKVDAVVRDATELGATHVILARTERSVVKLDASERLGPKLDRWKRVAEQAARQCGRSDPPAIDGVLDWTDALDRAADCDGRFCLDPRAKEPLGTALSAVMSEATDRSAAIAFAIGPEGGLSADEIEVAIGKGFLPASLGPFILRTETVAAAVLGAVRVLSSS